MEEPDYKNIKMELDLHMPKIPRYLVTTSDERTWQFDRPVLFLGEWCRLYDRKNIWKDMDAIVAAPYGLGKLKKDTDYALARNLEEKLFPILCNTLNEFHNKQYSNRFWRILLGHWLQRFVDVILNRVNTLELCLESYKINGTSAFSDDDYTLAPVDSNAAIWAFNDVRWNNALYIRILNLLGVTNCPVEVTPETKSERITSSIAATEIPIKKRIRELAYCKISRISGTLARKEDAFIINTYLPRNVVIKFQLALGQMPQMWTSPKFLLIKKPDLALRKNLSDQIDGKSDSLFGIMCSLVFDLMPVCYLEGLIELNAVIQQLPWPKKPRFIFTSNNFDTDEVFKLWAATKVESGSKYITGQHGNNYGTYRYMCPSNEEATADKFLTWGWEDGLPQHIPAFIFKTAGRKAETYNPKGGLLLIEVHLPHRINSWDGTSEFNNYFSDQKKFVNELNSSPKSILTIRLHSAFTHLEWSEVDRWKEFDSTLKLDTGTLPIEKVIARSRLVIHSYDSTGILETLSQNIPTLAFWQNGFDHLRDNAIPYYQLLLDAGIVHLSPESIAAKVNEVWGDVEGWWSQIKIQDARKQFCDKYAKISKKPIKELIILTKN